MSRMLVFGDIHGCMTALTTLIELVSLCPDDLVITLGDYVDRGPDSREVIEWLIQRHSQGKLIPLRGNHEAMMLDARCDRFLLDSWLGVGGRETLKSYASNDQEGSLKDIPESHWKFLREQTLPYYETQRFIFVHANLQPDCPLDEQPEETLYWEKFRNPAPHESGKIMICGHTPQLSLRPLDIGHAVCIDTWVYGRGYLTCLDPVTGEFWQANQHRETRRDWLDSR